MKIEERKAEKTLAVKTVTPAGEISKALDNCYGKVMGFMQSKNIQPSGAPFSIYFNEDMEALEMEAGFPVSADVETEGDVILSTIPSGKAFVHTHKGAYDSVAQAYNEMMAYVKEKNLKMSGICYERYLNDPSETKPEDLLTEIVFMLA